MIFYFWILKYFGVHLGRWGNLVAVVVVAYNGPRRKICKAFPKVQVDLIDIDQLPNTYVINANERVVRLVEQRTSGSG